jgi:methyl-accepting chemotaxis protein
MRGTIQFSVKTKFLVIIISAILFLSVITLIGAIITINSISSDNIKNYRNDLYAKTNQELKNYVQVTLQTIDSFYQRTSKKNIQEEVKGHLTEQSGLLFTVLQEQYEVNKNRMSQQQLKTHLLNLVKSVRYGNSGYFWINDSKGIMIMHPVLPELNGKNLYDMEDAAGKKFMKAFVHVVNSYNEGFVKYKWPKPDTQKVEDKISFVKRFKPFDWIIGTGEYTQDVTAKLKKEALKTISEIRYGKNGYFWINDTTPKMIVHPIMPELDGQDMSQIKDSNDVYIFQEFVKTTARSQEGGIVKYLWEKPGHKIPQPKFSYVQLFEPWGWIIGTGAYVDDVESKILLMQEKTKQSINIVIIASAVIFIIVLIVISLITLAISTNPEQKRI